jgi:hypothetical protein
MIFWPRGWPTLIADRAFWWAETITPLLAGQAFYGAFGGLSKALLRHAIWRDNRRPNNSLSRDTEFSGRPFSIYGKEIVFSIAHIHDEMLAVGNGSQ